MDVNLTDYRLALAHVYKQEWKSCETPEKYIFVEDFVDSLIESLPLSQVDEATVSSYFHLRSMGCTSSSTLYNFLLKIHDTMNTI